NWSKSSNMLSRYEHLASSDQEDAILKLHGLKKQGDSESILLSRICPSCKERNSTDKSHCVKCGTILSKKLAQQREARRHDEKSIIENYAKDVANLKKDYNELKHMLVKILKEKSG
ncbi:MAG: hypothetical protein KGL95_02540, partial [Patescibacteria group bacterium]|nr:hypothetical protein [Patescibacteria group bacterium]